MNKDFNKFLSGLIHGRGVGKTTSMKKELHETYLQIYFRYKKIANKENIQCNYCQDKALYKCFNGGSYCKTHINDYKAYMNNAFIKSKVKPGTIDEFKSYFDSIYGKDDK